ncbi:DMT family transporter [Starkeya sp. ORNL1]|uniref:DMT family transporter n=1 Tax=Starkeya sp. ORNL1 TaxID=2709380 RepID=UPI00146388DE|nr:DMT family transporter [Starkeya sp. ORNL1]QJP13518.1 DMT family transporter [Starkeya sp. ORNL1]
MPGSSVSFVLYLVAVGAGVSIAFQQILNSNLRIELGSPWWAGFVSYFVGTLAMLAAIIISGGSLLSPSMIARTSWISWTGGIFGAVFIGTAILMVPRLGGATVLALVVVGQMIGSLAFDHFGLLGVAQHAASPTRLLGAAFLVIGVVLIARH